MSRGILYSSLAVLVALLSFISYLLQKETAPPAPPADAQAKAAQAAQHEGDKKRMMEQMKAEHKKMDEMKAKAMAQSKQAGKANPASRGMQISGKWFEYDKPGREGIEHPAVIPDEEVYPPTGNSKNSKAAAKAALKLSAPPAPVAKPFHPTGMN